MKFGCCKQLWAVVNWKLSERCGGGVWDMKQRLCCWPSPVLGDMLLYLSPNKRHAPFLEAYTRRSLCDELSSASVNSCKTVDSSRCYFDLFWSAALASAATRTSEMLIQIPGSVNCKQHAKKKSTRMIITFIHNTRLYIFFFSNHRKWLLCFKVMRIKINPPKLFALHIFGHFVPWWGAAWLCCVGWISTRKN